MFSSIFQLLPFIFPYSTSLDPIWIRISYSCEGPCVSETGGWLPLVVRAPVFQKLAAAYRNLADVYDNQSDFHGRMKSIEDERKREHLVNARMDIMHPSYYKISFYQAPPIFRQDRDRR